MVFYQQVTISLLEKAMDESPHQRFLIDGFPRNEENRSSYESQVITLEGLPTLESSKLKDGREN